MSELLALVSLFVPAGGQIVSQPHGTALVSLGENVTRFEPACGGERAVFLSGPASVVKPELYSARTDGREPAVRLNDELVGQVLDFWVSPDGACAVYRADRDALGRSELFVVPSDGSQAPLKLSGALVAGGQVDSFQFTPDGARGVYVAEQDEAGIDELYVVPIDGSQPALRLGPQIKVGSQLVAIGPDGIRAAFYGSDAVAQVDGLFSVPLDGSSAPLLLALQTSRPVTSLRISPDASHVVFERTDSFYGNRLYSAPLDGSAAEVQLNVAEEIEFQITGDGAHVLYLDVNTFEPSRGRLYRVAIDGGTPTEINDTLGSDRGVKAFELTPDCARIVYIADADRDDRFELYSGPSTGGPAIHLNHPLAGSGDVLAAKVDPSGERVLYVASFARPPDIQELFSVPVAGGTPVVVSAPMVTGGDIAFHSSQPVLAFDGGEVLYLADQDVDQVFELYRAPIDGHALAQKLSGPLVTGGDVQFDLRPGRARQALYRADANVDGRMELFATPLRVATRRP